nr:MAG TPA: hypothetical protein [Caudoviricetes sp.]
MTEKNKTEVEQVETEQTPEEHVEEKALFEPLDMEKALPELKLGTPYKIGLVLAFKDKDGKDNVKRATLAHYNLETKTFCDDGQIIFRFQSLFNQTLFFLDKDGTPQGDFHGWVIENIEVADPVFVKHLQMPETTLVEKATEAFGDDAVKVIEFMKSL